MSEKVVNHKCICGKFKDRYGNKWHNICIKHWDNKRWIKNILKERCRLIAD